MNLAPTRACSALRCCFDTHPACFIPSLFGQCPSARSIDINLAVRSGFSVGAGAMRTGGGDPWVARAGDTNTFLGVSPPHGRPKGPSLHHVVRPRPYWV